MSDLRISKALEAMANAAQRQADALHALREADVAAIDRAAAANDRLVNATIDKMMGEANPLVTLSADIYGDDDTPDPEQHDVSLEALNTLTRRLNGARKRLEAVRAPYTAELRRIAEREEWATGPLLERCHDLEMQVHFVAIALLEREPKVKSWKLPHATVQTRRTGTEILVEDERALIAWATDAAPELLYEVPKIDRKAVKTRLTILPDQRTVATPAGELVPGVVVKPEQVSVTVREATADDVEPM